MRGDGWQGVLEAPVCGKLSLLHGEDGCDQRDHARCAAGMAHLSDQGIQQQRCSLPCRAVDVQNRLDDFPVGGGQSHAIGGQRRDIGCRGVGIAQGSADGGPQGLVPRRIVGGTDPPHDGVDRIAVAPGVREAFEQQDANCFTGQNAIGLSVKRPVRTGIGG